MSKSTNDLKDGTRCMGCSDVRGPGYLARPGSWDLNEERGIPRRGQTEQVQKQKLRCCPWAARESRTEASMERGHSAVPTAE